MDTVLCISNIQSCRFNSPGNSKKVSSVFRLPAPENAKKGERSFMNENMLECQNMCPENVQKVYFISNLSHFQHFPLL